MKREAAEHAAKLAKAEERGRQRAIKLMQEKEAIAQAEAKAYEEELEEGKRVKALFARKEEQERREREALEELRAEKLARERAAQKAAAAEAKARRDAEFAQAMVALARGPKSSELARANGRPVNFDPLVDRAKNASSVFILCFSMFSVPNMLLFDGELAF